MGSTDTEFDMGRRVLVCAFSPVEDLYPVLGLPSVEGLRSVLVEAVLAAPAAYYDETVGAVVRGLPRIAASFDQLGQARLSPDDFAYVRHWLVTADNGGAAGPNPRYYWRKAILWVADSGPELPQDMLQLENFCADVADALRDPEWRARVDAAVTAPYDARDLSIIAHAHFNLMTDAGVGDLVNQVSTTLTPVRSWHVIEKLWRCAPPSVHAAMQRLLPLWYEAQCATDPAAKQMLKGQAPQAVLPQMQEIVDV